ncbi:MAG: hypothetical protein AB1938_15715 [Myxococcota bacterium]
MKRYNRLPMGPEVRALHEARKPGCCLLCDAPLPGGRGKPRTLCGHPDCHRGWMACYQADRRAFYRRGES